MLPQLHPFSAFLAPSEIEALGRVGRELTFSPRSLIVRQGAPIDCIHLLCLGSIRLGHLSPQGMDVVFSFKGRGYLLGIFSYLSASATHVATATPLEFTKVISYERNEFVRLMERIPALEAEVRRQISESFRELQMDRKMERANAPQRLAAILLQLLRRHPERRSQSLPIPLSKADLARRIGAEPETVTRILNDWKRRKLIESRGRVINICDTFALERIAGPGGLTEAAVSLGKD